MNVFQYTLSQLYQIPCNLLATRTHLSNACWSKNSNTTCVYMYFVFCKHTPAKKWERKRNLNSGIGNHYYDYTYVWIGHAGKTRSLKLRLQVWMRDCRFEWESAGLNERLQVRCWPVQNLFLDCWLLWAVGSCFSFICTGICQYNCI